MLFPDANNLKKTQISKGFSPAPQRFDFLEPICSTCPQLECLVAEGSYTIPEEISFCVRYHNILLRKNILATTSLIARWKPLSFVHNVKNNYWSLVFGFGNMDAADETLDTGIMLAIYESGPWLGFRTADQPAIVGWVGSHNKPFHFMVK